MTLRSDTLNLQTQPTRSLFTYRNITQQDYKDAFNIRERRFGMTFLQILKTTPLTFSNAIKKYLLNQYNDTKNIAHLLFEID